MRAKIISLIALIFLLLLPLTTVGDPGHADGEPHGDEIEEEKEDEDITYFGIEMEGLGEIAQILFIFTLTIIVWKPGFLWLRKKGPELFKKEAKPFKKSLNKFNKRYMSVHIWAGFFAALLGTVHGYFLEWHWTLWAGTAAIWTLVISGGLLKWKWPPKEFRKGARILHMQRALTVLAIVLLVVGHELVD